MSSEGDLMNRLKIYEFFGARKFQKFVFKVERLKFKMLKPFSSKIIKFCDRRIDYKISKLIKREQNQVKRNSIILYGEREKLHLRVEFQSEKNRNYHINLLKPEEIITYLNINKKIHERGLISNFIFLVLSVTGLFMLSGAIINFLVIFLLYQIFSSFINFECINLQNYNITRIENKIETLKKVRERRISNRARKYGEVVKVISPLVQKGLNNLQKKEIIDSLSTLEQLEQMKTFLDEAINLKEDNYTRRFKL